MGHAAASLLILTVLTTAALALSQMGLASTKTISESMQSAMKIGDERAKTIVGLSSLVSKEVFRCTSKVELTASNLGDVELGDLESMDLLIWYQPASGDRFTARLDYVTGNIGEDQWTIAGSTPQDLTPLWDRGEDIEVVSRLRRAPLEGTTGYVMLTTSSGVTASGYVGFLEGATAECLYLHNYPSPPLADTTSQATLPLDTGLPMVQTLYNYDSDRDSSPGLTLARTNQGLVESDPNKFQFWRTGPLGSDLAISGDVLIELFASLSPLYQGEAGIIITYLRDHDGNGGYTEIGDGAAFSRDWQAGSVTFVERVAMIPGVGYTVPEGHELELRLVVDDASGQDMEFAYDAAQYASFVNLSFVPPVPSTSLYLHNNPTPPTGDTPRQAVLPIDATVPSASFLYDYDVPDGNPGLQLKNTSLGLAKTNPDQFQLWRTDVLAIPMVIVGDVFVDLWAAIRNYQKNQPGAVTLYLRDYDGSSYIEIANGSVFVFDWQRGTTNFVRATIAMLDVDHTVPAGHQLEVRLYADDIKASKDMWFAYDTVWYPSVIKLP